MTAALGLERIIPVWYVSSHNSDFCGELLAADPPDLLVDGLELLVERGEHERLSTLSHPLRRKDKVPARVRK